MRHHTLFVLFVVGLSIGCSQSTERASISITEMSMQCMPTGRPAVEIGNFMTLEGRFRVKGQLEVESWEFVTDDGLSVGLFEAEPRILQGAGDVNSIPFSWVDGGDFYEPCSLCVFGGGGVPVAVVVLARDVDTGELVTIRSRLVSPVCNG